MSERRLPAARGATGPIAAVALGLAVVSAAPAFACTAVAAQVELCTEGTEWEHVRAQRFDDVVTWVGEDYVIEFNPLLSAAAPAGPMAAALDQMVAMLLDEPGAPAAETVLRDRFRTDVATVERIVMELDEDGETYLGSLILTDFSDGTPRLAWSMAGFDGVTLDDMRELIETTAAGLRPGPGT